MQNATNAVEAAKRTADQALLHSRRCKTEYQRKGPFVSKGVNCWLVSVAETMLHDGVEQTR